MGDQDDYATVLRIATDLLTAKAYLSEFNSRGYIIAKPSSK
jgi:hypothetical protein